MIPVNTGNKVAIISIMTYNMAIVSGIRTNIVKQDRHPVIHPEFSLSKVIFLHRFQSFLF